MHIAVAGNIGCGKTTLTNMLAKHYGWEPRFESVEYNPYLSDFYADMARWSFNLQIYFPRIVPSMRMHVFLLLISMSRVLCPTVILRTIRICLT